jgi:glycosyltransferase involved in cell wall biosynthesis
VLNLGRELRHDYRVHMVCGPDVGQEGSIYEEVAAEFDTTLLPILRRPIRPLEDLRAVGALRRLFERLQPALVHTHSSKAGILGRRAARGLGPAVVHTVHGWGHTPDDSALKRRLLVAAERRAAAWSDRLVAVSQATRDEGLALGIGRPEQYEVIPAWVDYTPSDPDALQARAAARSELGLPHDAQVLGWVGRFMPQKDPLTLSRALREVLERRPAVHACLIGDGPLRGEVERELAAAGVVERARFAGFRSDVRRLYPAFDVLLHTSRWEGQPRVIHEAIAERVPVVAAGVPGTSEILAAAKVGLEVEPGDASGYAARAEQALDSDDLRYPLPGSNVERLAQAHGRETVLRRHLELYRALVLSS